LDHERFKHGELGIKWQRHGPQQPPALHGHEQDHQDLMPSLRFDLVDTVTSLTGPVLNVSVLSNQGSVLFRDVVNLSWQAVKDQTIGDIVDNVRTLIRARRARTPDDIKTALEGQTVPL